MSCSYSLAYKDKAHAEFLQIFSVPGIPDLELTPALIELITRQEGFERLVSVTGFFPLWAKTTLPDGRRMLMDSNPDRRRVLVESRPQVPGRSQWLRVVENEDQVGDGRQWIYRDMPTRIQLCLSQWTSHAIMQMRRQLVPVSIAPPMPAPKPAIHRLGRWPL